MFLRRTNDYLFSILDREEEEKAASLLAQQQQQQQQMMMMMMMMMMMRQYSMQNIPGNNNGTLVWANPGSWTMAIDVQQPMAALGPALDDDPITWLKRQVQATIDEVDWQPLRDCLRKKKGTL